MITDIKGINNSVETSLKEYGFLMGKNEHCSENEYVVIWQSPYDEDKFSIGYVPLSDIFELWEKDNWSDPRRVGEYCGTGILSPEQITENPFGALWVMYSFWGPVEIFGEDYSGGLSYSEIMTFLSEDL